MTPNANVNDTGSIKAVYPLSAYEADAGSNSAGHAHFLRGVRIESRPDENGAFRLVRATQSLSDDDHPTPSSFLCPYMGRAYGHFALRGGGRGAVEETRDIFQSDLDEYDAFIARIAQAALHAAQPTGGDPQRLAGWG